MNKGSFLLKGLNGLRLQGTCWLPDGEAKAVICLVHGLGEHRGRYQHVAEAMVRAGYGLYAYDQRGHGESEGKRGYTPGYDALLHDLDIVLQMIAGKNAETPIFLYGHSMGGNVVANYLLYRDISRLRGAILTSPWLYLTHEPPGIQVALAKFIVKLFPTFAQGNGLKIKDLSHDPVVNQAYKDDPLVHGKISARLFLDAYAAGHKAVEHADQLALPTLLVHGSDDQITSPEGTKAFAEKAGDTATLKIWDGLYHETHNEPNKDEVIQATIDWLDAHIS